MEPQREKFLMSSNRSSADIREGPPGRRIEPEQGVGYQK